MEVNHDATASRTGEKHCDSVVAGHDHRRGATADVVDQLDAWVERLNKETRARWSRNALLLAIVDRALRERAEKGEEP